MQFGPAHGPLVLPATVHRARSLFSGFCQVRDYRGYVLGLLSSPPVRANVGFGVLVRPAVQDRCERTCLRAAGGQVLLEYKHQHDVAFSSEVGNVLGDDGSAIGPGSSRNVSVLSTREAGRVDRVVTVFLPQQRGRGRREHLVD